MVVVRVALVGRGEAGGDEEVRQTGSAKVGGDNVLGSEYVDGSGVTGNDGGGKSGLGWSSASVKIS